jgi:GMP synthase (glutamine-hydrolysing)
MQTILVLDFGSQTSHLILRRLRSLKVYAEMLPCTTQLADLPFKPKGIVLSGGECGIVSLWGGRWMVDDRGLGFH